MDQKRRKIREKGYKNEMNALGSISNQLRSSRKEKKKKRERGGRENGEVIIKEIILFPELKQWATVKRSLIGINKTGPAHIRWDFLP